MISTMRIKGTNQNMTKIGKNQQKQQQQQRQQKNDEEKLRRHISG